MQHRARVLALSGHVAGGGVADRQPRLGAVGGEAGARLAGPRHRRAALVAVAGRIAGPVRHRVERERRVELDVGQADLVAVVEERRAAQGEEQHQRGARTRLVAAGPARGEPACVVVGARPHRPGARRQPLLDRLHDRAHLRHVQGRVHEEEVEREVELVLARAVVRDQLVDLEHVGLAHEDAVAVGDPPPALEDVVHLGAVHGEDLTRAALAHLGVIVGRGRRVVAQVAVLDDRVADVDPEAGDPAVEPEAQDVVEGLADVVAPPVEVGLARQEVVEVVLAGGLVERPRRAAEVREPVVGCLRPDVEVAVLGLRAGQRVDEPRVPVARVVGDEVEQHADAAAARLGDQRVHVLERPELRVHAGVVGDVVAPVVVRRGHRRIQPDAVDPEPLEVVKVRHDALQVADPVAVRIRERARVDLVQDSVSPPRHAGAGYEPAHQCDVDVAFV